MYKFRPRFREGDVTTEVRVQAGETGEAAGCEVTGRCREPAKEGVLCKLEKVKETDSFLVSQRNGALLTHLRFYPPNL